MFECSEENIRYALGMMAGISGIDRATIQYHAEQIVQQPTTISVRFLLIRFSVICQLKSRAEYFLESKVFQSPISLFEVLNWLSTGAISEKLGSALHDLD
jgi:hypothetical protein